MRILLEQQINADSLLTDCPPLGSIQPMKGFQEKQVMSLFLYILALYTDHFYIK